MEALCELIVPGSSRVGPVVYVDALIAGMPPPVRDGALASIDALAPAAAAGRRRAGRAGADARVRVRPRARDRGVLLATSSRREGRAGRVGGDRLQLAAGDAPQRRTGRGWGSREGRVRRRRGRVRRRRRRDRGRARAARPRRPARRARAAPPRCRLHALRGEGGARSLLAAPLRAARDGELVTFLAGRCVGGTTTINTKVAFRAHERDVAKWHPATGLTSDGSDAVRGRRPRAVLRPRRAGARRARADRLEEERPHGRARLPRARRRARGRQRVHGRELHELRLLHPGLPVERRQVDDEHVHRATRWPAGSSSCGPTRRVERVLIDGRRGDGRRGTSTATGERHTVRAGAVVVAAGALNTPQLLLRSGLENAAIGRHLGLHPVRLVYGLFDEPQDAHMVYPITAHCLKYQHDEDGGFVIEATTIQDPIAFATTLGDEDGPFWGPRLVEAVQQLPALDRVPRDGERRQQLGRRRRRGRRGADRGRLPAGRARAHRRMRSRFSRDVLEAAGATQVCWTGLVSTHVQGRAGWATTRRARSSTGTASRTTSSASSSATGRSCPRTLSVNPSLTIMALATRLAEHLDADANGYLGAQPRLRGRHESGAAQRVPPPARARRAAGARADGRAERRRRGSAAPASARPTCTRSTGSWSRPG